MATSLVIEEERGTCRGHVHPHNGYYAGTPARRAVESVEPSGSAVGPATGLTVSSRAAA